MHGPDGGGLDPVPLAHDLELDHVAGDLGEAEHPAPGEVFPVAVAGFGQGAQEGEVFQGPWGETGDGAVQIFATI